MNTITYLKFIKNTLKLQDKLQDFSHRLHDLLIIYVFIIGP